MGFSAIEMPLVKPNDLVKISTRLVSIPSFGIQIILAATVSPGGTS